MQPILKTVLAASLACIFAGSVHAQTNPKISGNAVKIGVITDMSGLYADFGGPTAVIAAQMAIDDFGGKVLGAPISIVSADHQNKADVANTKAREWYDTQGVDMITESLNSSVALSIAKLSAEKKRIFMPIGPASTRLTNEDCTKYTIHYAYDTYALAYGTGNAVVQNGGKSWFFLTADYAFGHSLEKDTGDIVKAAGGEIKGAVRHPLATNDFSSFLLQAQASGAQIVGLANAGGDTVNSIKAANEFGLTKKQKLAGLLLQISDIHSLGLKTAQGLLMTDGWYWDMNDDTRKFAKRYFDRTKRMPGMVHAGVYSAVTTYLKAIQAAGTDDADAVRAALGKAKISDVFTKNGFIREDGRMVHDMYLVEVKKPEESKAPWDYFKILSTIPGDKAFQSLAASRCPLIKKP
jgi:branched-chain amino acid transport system substrate-binding protein